MAGNWDANAIRTTQTSVQVPIRTPTEVKADRDLATLVCIGAIFFPFLAPILGVAISKKGSATRYFSILNLIQQLVWGALQFLVVALSLGYSLYGLIQTGFDWKQIDWVAMMIKSVIVWAALALFQLINLISAIREILDLRSKKNLQFRWWTQRLARRRSGFDGMITPQSESILASESNTRSD